MPDHSDHADHAGHEHHHHGAGGHVHAPANFGRAFAIGIALNVAYVLAEAFYGVASHSLALLADAGHNLGDVLGLAAAWGASILSKRRPSGKYTYGLRRSSILAALGNAVVLLVVTGGIAWEGIRRLLDPEPTAGVTIMVVAALGIFVNGITAWLFMSGRKGDMNVRGRLPAHGVRRLSCIRRRGRGRTHPLDRVAMAGPCHQLGHQRRHRLGHVVACCAVRSTCRWTPFPKASTRTRWKASCAPCPAWWRCMTCTSGA